MVKKSPSVAVIDIGSNSIKVLVASRDARGKLVAVKYRTLDARISAGIAAAVPRLSEEGMRSGLGAIRELLDEAALYRPQRIALVATSAVRDAANGADFRAKVRTATKHDIRILTGDEEANLIGRGLTADPALANLRDFYVFDLGGGSLECLAFRARKVEHAASLQLGCVRLTEKFLPDPAQPFPDSARAQVAAHTAETIAASTFRFALPPGSAAVGTGGTLSTIRAMRAARTGRTFDQTDAAIPLLELRETYTWLAALPLPERKKIPGLPPARADVFPTALATVITLAELGGFDAYWNSLFNLRWGLAAEMLEEACPK